MNVKNMSEFVKDIDEPVMTGWELEQDCHEKVKKLTIRKRMIITGKERNDTVQITLENNPRYAITSSRFRGDSINPAKYWEVPERALDDINFEKSEKTEREFLKELSRLVSYPIKYEGSYHKKCFSDGEARCLA